MGNSSAPDPRSPSAPTPPRKRFALTGPAAAYDPATTAARADIADVRLAETVFAPHYAAPMARPLVADAVLCAERDGAPAATLRMGEVFEVLELTPAYAWGVAQPSGLVGYIPRTALGGT